MRNKELLEDLYEAIEEDNLERVEFLISQGVNLNKSIEDKKLPLYLAIESNKFLIACKIIGCLKEKINDEVYKDVISIIVKTLKDGNLQLVFDKIDNFINYDNKKDLYLKEISKIDRSYLVDNKIIDSLRRTLNKESERRYLNNKPKKYPF